MVARLQGLERRAKTLEKEVKEEELKTTTVKKKTEPSRKSFGGLDNRLAHHGGLQQGRQVQVLLRPRRPLQPEPPQRPQLHGDRAGQQ